METTESKAHGIHLKMWERQRSRAADHRNITLPVNEYAIVPVRYGTACVSRRQQANTSAFSKGRNNTAARDERQTGEKTLETISYSVFLSMHSAAPCNFRRSIAISSVLTASLKWTNWTWFVMCSFFFFFFHYAVSNSTSPPQILKNRMWAREWERGSPVAAAKSTRLPEVISW